MTNVRPRCARLYGAIHITIGLYTFWNIHITYTLYYILSQIKKILPLKLFKKLTGYVRLTTVD